MELSLIEKHLRPEYYCKQTNKTLKYVGLSPQVYFQLLPHLDVKIFNLIFRMII
jgi:hypothetical protein